MNDLFQSHFTLAACIGAVVAMAVSSTVWLAIGRRISRGKPLVPYQGRRPVPWKTLDVVVIFGLYFFPMILGVAALAFQAPADRESASQPQISPPPTTEAADHEEVDVANQVEGETVRVLTTEEDQEEVDTHHSAIDLLLQDGTPLTWILCFLAAVVVAPLAEEFLFRLVLQGRLEAAERRRQRAGTRPLVVGAKPILVSSILFAAVHFREAAPAVDPNQLRTALLFQIIWSPMAVAYAVAWLRFRIPDLTAADLGIDPRKIKSDIGLGLSAFLAVACPIYFLQAVLTWLWPNVVPDPIPLFFLALALGLLYHRTHRLLPAIVLHMALNGTSLIMVWLLLSKSPAT